MWKLGPIKIQFVMIWNRSEPYITPYISMKCIQKSRTVFTRPNHWRFFNSCVIHIQYIYIYLNVFIVQSILSIPNHSRPIFQALRILGSNTHSALALQCALNTLDNIYIVHYKLLERNSARLYLWMKINACVCAIRKWLCFGWASA